MFNLLTGIFFGPKGLTEAINQAGAEYEKEMSRGRQRTIRRVSHYGERKTRYFALAKKTDTIQQIIEKSYRIKE